MPASADGYDAATAIVAVFFLLVDDDDGNRAAYQTQRKCVCIHTHTHSIHPGVGMVFSVCPAEMFIEVRGMYIQEWTTGQQVFFRRSRRKKIIVRYTSRRAP